MSFIDDMPNVLQAAFQRGYMAGYLQAYRRREGEPTQQEEFTMGKVAIQALDDTRLAQIAASRPPTADEAKRKIAGLETAIDAAKTKHNMLFGTRTVGTDQESLQRIASLQSELHWSRRDLEHRQGYADNLKAREASEAHASLPKTRMFQVGDQHGRITRHRAHDAEHLRKGRPAIPSSPRFSASRLTGRAALPLRLTPLMAGLLTAHGDELASWLEMHGFERKDA
jgi:hypothetical protein